MTNIPQQIPAGTCPQCGKSLTQGSTDPCRCPPSRPNFLRGKTIDGPVFVRTILIVCLLVTLAAVGLFFMIVRLRVAHGLPGLE